MGWWQVNADTLAGSRFVVSPLAETFASLKLLHAGAGGHPGELAWLSEHLPAYRRRLSRDPVTALLVRSGLGREWIADFLTPTPKGSAGFAEEVTRVRVADPAAARAHLTVSLRGGPGGRCSGPRLVRCSSQRSGGEAARRPWDICRS